VRARFDPGITEYASELVLDVGVSSQAPFDQRRIDAERVSASGQVGYLCLAVRRAEARACGTQRRLMRNGEHGIELAADRFSERGVELGRFGGSPGSRPR
jgi:hypothetical protein